MGVGAKPKAPVAGRKAVAQALKRRGLKGRVTSHELCPTMYEIEFEPTDFPKVSVIIPTRNALPLMTKCLASLRRHTDYPNFEIVVIDNASDDPRLLEYLREEQSENGVRVINYEKPFNHSDMNNIAVKSTDSQFVVFMNNDTEIISDRWLEQLVATVNIDESIGCVGCLLLYSDGIVQHGGIILGLNGATGHAHQHIDSKSPGYFGRLHCIQELSAVTAALSVIRRSAFDIVGGFRPDEYPTVCNDVDLCIRLRRRGFRCVYNPMVRAIHHESRTRPITAEDLYYKKKLVDACPEILANDPFYNPNLALHNVHFVGFRPFPVEEQIPELAMRSEERHLAKNGERVEQDVRWRVELAL